VPLTGAVGQFEAVQELPYADIREEDSSVSGSSESEVRLPSGKVKNKRLSALPVKKKAPENLPRNSQVTPNYQGTMTSIKNAMHRRVPPRRLKSSSTSTSATVTKPV